MRASTILGPDGPLSQAIDGYEHRPSQLAMADAVADAIAHRGVLLVEAGTGTGKTWAYLVPALLGGRRVIVSTGTKNLQDQILQRDLPALQRHVGLAKKAVAMKGLSNYLCLRRFELFRKSATATEAPFKAQLPVLEAWRETSVHGDRAELEALAEDAAIWPWVVSGADTRIGPRCPHHASCFVTKLRREAEQADLIVVNHHLFFADLALRGPHHGGILPDYDVVIFDEAHQLEDVATGFFGASVSTGKLERLARDAEAVLVARKTGGALLAQHLRTAGANFFAALPPVPGTGGNRHPLPQEAFTDALEQRFFALDDALEALGAHCRGRRTESESLGQLARRVGQLRDELGLVAEGADGRSVAWQASRGRGVTVGVSPVDVSETLREALYHRTDTVVMTSATLTTGGTFTFLRERLGIDFEVDELALASPFDYAAQAGLYLPDSLPEPRDPRFRPAAAEEIGALVEMTGGGAFVLCTATRQMHAFADLLRPRLVDAGLPVLVQGERPKARILERFQEAGNAVLFATASFWEGVDVPGDALRLVIIDKLPFEVPSDPLVRARCEARERAGGKPFMELLVPAAALALKQGFGRLVRSRKDRGLVAILDPRIRTRRYGKVFLESLPDASRCYSLDEARAFWALVSGPEITPA
ncbi:MAG: ATP-dependent DNA helicase [Myxococcota bacterium]